MDITPEQVEAEARRLALRNAGQLLMAMAERGVTEDQLAETLGVSLRSLRFHLRGQNWKGFLPIAAICLTLEVRLDTQTLPR